MCGAFRRPTHPSLTQVDRRRTVRVILSAMATFVLIHGGWGGGWEWREVERLLRTHGHEVTRPTLTGLGERVHLASSVVTLDTHVEDVVRHFEFEGLVDAVLCGHSYGGMVVTGVAES